MTKSRTAVGVARVRHTILLLGVLVSFLASCDGAGETTEKPPLAERINSPDWDTFSAARDEIETLGVRACPALYTCVQMTKGEAAPLRCLRPLLRQCPRDEAGAIIFAKLKENLQDGRRLKWLRDKYYVGALGKLKYTESAPLLESLLADNWWGRDLVVPLHLNWALHQITGIPRGPESDPFRAGAKK
jgi:hypothetical protein